MSSEIVVDRAFVAGCAALVGFLGTDPPPLGQVIAYLVLAVCVVLPASGRPRRQQESGVEQSLAEFRAAGFTEEQSRELVQEAIRAEIRKQGGWQP